MITTYNQAKRLEELGYDKECNDIYWSDGDFEENYGKFDWNNQDEEDCISAPTVSDALQWIREKYKMPLAVVFEWQPDLYENYHYEDFTYHGEIGIKKANGQSDYEYTGIFDTYPEAELSLLKQVVEYLIKKKK